MAEVDGKILYKTYGALYHRKQILNPFCVDKFILSLWGGKYTWQDHFSSVKVICISLSHCLQDFRLPHGVEFIRVVKIMEIKWNRDVSDIHISS